MAVPVTMEMMMDEVTHLEPPAHGATRTIITHLEIPSFGADVTVRRQIRAIVADSPAVWRLDRILHGNHGGNILIWRYRFCGAKTTTPAPE